MIADIAGRSADLIIETVQMMDNPQQLQDVAVDVLANGGGEVVQHLWSIAPKVAGAMVLAYALHQTGGALIEALKQGGKDITSKVKSFLGSGEGEAKAGDKTDSTRFD